jgi:putative tryptophan/tyrosine transport system substrate-binding protein
MKRREFIAGISAAAWPLVARAQQAVPVIGFLHNQSIESMRDKMEAFAQGLAEAGFVEGRNVAIEHLWEEGQVERRRALLADLVRRQVSLIIADTTNGGADAKTATGTIPIIFVAGADPVEFGLVSSLGHPGGNATGVASRGVEVTGKRLELLHKLVPGVDPIAMFIYTLGATDPVGTLFSETEARDFQSAARVLGLRVVVIDVRAEGSIAAAFEKLVELRAAALLLGADILWQQERTQIISLAARHEIPTMFWDRASATAGALSRYGPDVFETYHIVGIYTGRILKGEKPADLPVVQPTKFELVINLRTAKALGLTVPPTLLALADELQAHSRFHIQDGCGLPVATGAVS